MSLIGELAIGKGVDVLLSLLRGAARRLWEVGPVGRLLVLLYQDFGEETKLDRKAFYGWEKDEDIAGALEDLVSGRLLAGPEAEQRLAAAFETKLVETEEGGTGRLAVRMAQAAQQAAPLVVEGSKITVLIANRLDAHMGHVEEQLSGLQAGVDKLLRAHELEPAPSEEGVPVPPPAGERLPAIAEALLRGPLERANQFAAARRANELLRAGRTDEAAAAMRAVANALDQTGSPTLAERYREWAAANLEQAGRTEHAADLRVSVAFAQAQRGSSWAEITARKLREQLPEDRRWIADGIEAMVVWPEQPDAAVDQLRSAAAASGAERLKWAAPLIEILLLTGRESEALDVAKEVRVAELEPGLRMAIELDTLDAEERLGRQSAAEAGWERIIDLTRTREDLDEQLGVIWQRRTATLLRRDEFDAATEAATRAVEAWSRVAGAEQQAAEVLLDLQNGAAVLAKPPPAMELSALAASVQGSAETPSADAEQLERRAVEAQFAGRLPDALRAWSLALAVHHRSGNFRGTLVTRQRLGELYAEANLPVQALPHLLFAGQGKASAEVARSVSGSALAGVIRLDGPRWERAAAYDLLAEHGRRLPPDYVARHAEQALADAAATPDGFISPQPALSARTALAQMVLAFPQEHLDDAIQLLHKALEAGHPASVRAAGEALILATNTGVIDASQPLLEAFLDDASLTKISSLWVAERLEHRADLRAQVRDAAIDGNDYALEALSVAGLVENDTALMEACDAVARRAAKIETIKETRTEHGRTERATSIGFRFEGIALISEAASPDSRRALTNRLLQTLQDDREPELNRSSAANALFNLAGAIPDDLVGAVLEALEPLAEGRYEMSEVDRDSAASQHPLSRFRLGFATPDALRVAALNAWAKLLASDGEQSCGRLQRAINEAFRRGSDRLLAGALEALAQGSFLKSPRPLEQLMRHSNMRVRLGALHAWRARDRRLDELDLLPELLHDRELPVRLALVSMASPATGGGDALQVLSEDGDAYVRLMARAALAR